MYLQKQKHVNILLLHHYKHWKNHEHQIFNLDCNITKQCNQSRNGKIYKKMFMSFRGLLLETKELNPCNIFSLHFLPLQFLHYTLHHYGSFIAPIAIIIPLLHLSLQLAQFKHSILYRERHKKYISSYYNTEPLKSHIYIDGISYFWTFILVLVMGKCKKSDCHPWEDIGWFN
jgi:hypothetical protein